MENFLNSLTSAAQGQMTARGQPASGMLPLYNQQVCEVSAAATVAPGMPIGGLSSDQQQQQQQVTQGQPAQGGQGIFSPMDPYAGIQQQFAAAAAATAGFTRSLSPFSEMEQCTLCEQWFSNTYQLAKHMARAHNIGNAAFFTNNTTQRAKVHQCKTCGKQFANSSYLSQHNRIHLGVKPYKCQQPMCDKAFTQLSHLQQHKRTHTGERPYRCKFPNCTKSFTQMSNLESHTKSHMVDKPFWCCTCFKNMGSKEQLQVHIRQHQEQNLINAANASYAKKQAQTRQKLQALQARQQNIGSGTSSGTATTSGTQLTDGTLDLSTRQSQTALFSIGSSSSYSTSSYSSSRQTSGGTSAGTGNSSSQQPSITGSSQCQITRPKKLNFCPICGKSYAQRVYLQRHIDKHKKAGQTASNSNTNGGYHYHNSALPAQVQNSRKSDSAVVKSELTESGGNNIHPSTFPIPLIHQQQSLPTGIGQFANAAGGANNVFNSQDFSSFFHQNLFASSGTFFQSSGNQGAGKPLTSPSTPGYYTGQNGGPLPQQQTYDGGQQQQGFPAHDFFSSFAQHNLFAAAAAAANRVEQQQPGNVATSPHHQHQHSVDMAQPPTQPPTSLYRQQQQHQQQHTAVDNNNQQMARYHHSSSGSASTSTNTSGIVATSMPSSSGGASSSGPGKPIEIWHPHDETPRYRVPIKNGLQNDLNDGDVSTKKPKLEERIVDETNSSLDRGLFGTPEPPLKTMHSTTEGQQAAAPVSFGRQRHHLSLDDSLFRP